MKKKRDEGTLELVVGGALGLVAAVKTVATGAACVGGVCSAGAAAGIGLAAVHPVVLTAGATALLGYGAYKKWLKK